MQPITSCDDGRWTMTFRFHGTVYVETWFADLFLLGWTVVYSLVLGYRQALSVRVLHRPQLKLQHFVHTSKYSERKMPPLLTQVARVSDGLPLVATQTPAPGLPVTSKEQQEAKEILKKITSGMSGKMSITAGDKVFYYMTRDSLCFLAMAEARYPKRLAFLYLDEIGDLVLGEMVREFGNEWRDEVNSTARPFRFIHYDPLIQRKQKEFQDERQQRSKLNDDLSEIQNIMKKNITDILDRGEKLDNVQNISQDLLKQSSGFKWGARKLTFQARMQQYLPMIVIGVIVVFVIYVKFFW